LEEKHIDTLQFTENEMLIIAENNTVETITIDNIKSAVVAKDFRQVAELRWLKVKYLGIVLAIFLGVLVSEVEKPLYLELAFLMVIIVDVIALLFIPIRKLVKMSRF
jgi:membrane protein YdbS with pleckstrin-like domain